jgi:hypothetical protein
LDFSLSPRRQYDGVLILSKSSRWSVALDCAALFLLAALLVWPLFRLEYLNIWGSIESTFIADARFLTDNWPNPRWQPLWYLGTRFDFIYPPALRYGTATISKWGGVSSARAYHLYIALFYCFGIVGVYWLTRAGSGSRYAARLAGVTTALVSPAFLFLAPSRNDSLDWMPQRLWVLVRYGEGPHITALAWLGWALAFAWPALAGRRPVMLALAAVCSAMVVSNNFYGATALAVFFPIMLWSIFARTRDAWVLVRGAAIAAFTYGLIAFWLTPAYMRLTLNNLKWVAQPAVPWSRAVALIMMVAFAAGAWFAARRWHIGAWPLFVTGSLLFFAMHVLGERFLGMRIMGEPSRQIPELDLALILAIVTALAWAWRREWRWQRPVRIAAVVFVIAGLATAHGYIRRPWQLYVEDRDYQSRVEYRMQDWIARNAPQARVMTAGSIRFWWSAWNNLAQVGGGAEQGLLNPITVAPQWDVALREQAEPSVLWLKAIGADAIIVSDKTSQEEYHDYQYPRKFAGILPVLYDDARGNVIYSVPRRYPAGARVVETARLEKFRPKNLDLELSELREYVGILEQGPEAPIDMRWVRPSEIRLRARLGAGESMLVLVNYDFPWRAYTSGRAVEIRRDPLGFIWVHPGPGEHEIQLKFAMPAGNAAGMVLTSLTLIALVWSAAGGTLRMSRVRWLMAIAAGLLALSVLLNLALFFPGESPYRGSIEMGYAGMTRFIAEHPNPWGWNPLYYFGLPTQLMYPPLVHYVPAALTWITGGSPLYSYKLVTSALACAGPVAVFFFVLYLTRSRRWALVSALSCLLLSPGYGFIRQMNLDRGYAYLPWRLHVLHQYGEGPHNVGLTLIPLALTALFATAKHGRFVSLFAAAVLSAAVALTNWIAALALGIMSALMLLAGWRAPDVSTFRPWRIAAAGMLAYLLGCFWLTPSYVGTTAFNWPVDARVHGGNTHRAALLGCLVVLLAIARWALGKTRANFYPTFLALGAVTFCWIVLGFYWYGENVLPEAHRYAPEMEFFLLLGVCECLRLAWTSGHRLARRAAVAAALILLAAGSRQVFHYFTQGWYRWSPVATEASAEYRIADWLLAHRPEGRVFASGGTRYRVAALTGLPQVTGTFESGLRNRSALHVAHQVRTGAWAQPGTEAEAGVLLLKASGVEYAVMHAEDSREFYRDVKQPEKFKSVLERVYSAGGDSIYRVPFSGYAHLALPEELPKWIHPLALRPFIAGMEDAARGKLVTRWRGPGELEIEGSVRDGMLVSVIVNHDPGWEARQDGTPIVVEPSPTGLIVLKARPSTHSRIVLRYRGTKEQKAMAAVSAAAWLGCALMLLRRRRTAVIPESMAARSAGN